MTHAYTPPAGWEVLLDRRDREAAQIFGVTDDCAALWVDWWQRELASGREPSGGYRLVKRQRVAVGGPEDVALRLAAFLAPGSVEGSPSHREALARARGVVRRSEVACG